MSTLRASTSSALERERERFLAAIVDSAEDAIFAKGLDGTILSWNGAAERMYGYAPEDIVGSSVLRLAPPDRHDEIRGFLARLARGDAVRHHETERVRRNGERFPVSLAISPVRDATGVIVGASTIARDISQERANAQAMAFQRAMLEAQNQASLDGLVVFDLEDRVVFSNTRLAELWNLPPDGVPARGEALLEAMARSVVDREGFIGVVRGARTDSGEPTRDTVRLSDGRVLDRYSAPLTGQDGVLSGRVWSFRDITRETTRLAQLRSVISAMNEAALVFGPDGRVLLRNPAASALLPQVEHERDLRRLIGQGERTDAAAGIGTEVTIETPTGPRCAIASIEPVTDPSGSSDGAQMPLLGWLGIVRDVTELRETQASREAFLGVLSHELRTPITMIYGGAKMLLREDLQADRLAMLRDIEAESDRLYRLVEDLLVLTRIERETLQLIDQPMLIGPIVERVIAAERAREPGALIRVSLGDGLPMVRGEDTYVEQIVRNLVGNALKYGPPGGPIDIVVERGGRGVVVRVLDTGPGIAEDEADRVFELLYRSPSTAAQAAGSGIGLFVGRRLAQEMGGALGASRRPEGGSEFRLELVEYLDDEG